MEPFSREDHVGFCVVILVTLFLMNTCGGSVWGSEPTRAPQGLHIEPQGINEGPGVYKETGPNHRQISSSHGKSRPQPPSVQGRWAMCKLDYGRKGTYPTLGMIVGIAQGIAISGSLDMNIGTIEITRRALFATMRRPGHWVNVKHCSLIPDKH